jgi:hypothetical protein
MTASFRRPSQDKPAWPLDNTTSRLVVAKSAASMQRFFYSGADGSHDCTTSDSPLLSSSPSSNPGCHATTHNGGDLFTIGKHLQPQEHRMALEILNYLYRSATLAPAGMPRKPLRIVPQVSARFRYGVALFVLAIAAPAMACWNEAAQRYGVNPQLLYAIAKTESGLNPRALNRNPDGSYDIGLMQINSRWIPTLRRYGISEARLFEPCTSIHVGAWILAQNMRRLGNTWNAVGAYNAKTPAQRLQYAIKVYRNIPPEALQHR